MTTCELWVRGSAENGSVVYADVLVTGGWNSLNPFPALSVVNTDNFGRGVFTRYSSNPPWQYNNTGWYQYPEFYLKNCQGISPNQPCDCVNGGCVPKTTYNTPGVFPNLAACQSGCAKNSNCTGECVDPAEIAAHQQAINTLKAKIC